MAQTAFVFPGTGTSDASIGTVAWTNPGRITVSNDSSASASSAGTTQYLRGSNFGFSLPSQSTILGIEVRVERQAPGASVVDGTIRIFDASGNPVGDNKSAGAAWTTSSTDEIVTFGGPTDPWGLTLAEADVEDVDFGVGVSAVITTPLPFVDAISMKLHYTFPGEPLFTTIPGFRLPRVM